MAATGQRCPLCSESLLKFLFNPNGDYIVNCSSRICLYGALHAKFYRSYEQPAEETSIIDVEPKACDVDRATTSFGGETSAFNEVSNQVDSFPTYEAGNERTAFDMMDSTPEAQMSDSFPASFGLPIKADLDQDDDMINQWVQELMGPSADVASPAQVPVPVSVEVAAPKIEPVAPQPENVAVVSTARVRKASMKKAAASAPKLAQIVTKPPPIRKVDRTISKSKVSTAAADKSLKLAGRSRRSQAIASTLRSHLGANDDIPSEASSDSGIQSDASSDRSSSSTSLTPIQRLLHIEEAKKRSWGVTGMPGFKPSATIERRKKAAAC